MFILSNGFGLDINAYSGSSVPLYVIKASSTVLSWDKYH